MNYIQNEIAKRICDNISKNVHCIYAQDHTAPATIILQLENSVRIELTLNRNTLVVDIPTVCFTKFSVGYATEGFDPAKLEEALLKISKKDNTLDLARFRDEALQIICAAINRKEQNEQNEEIS